MLMGKYVDGVVNLKLGLGVDSDLVYYLLASVHDPFQFASSVYSSQWYKLETTTSTFCIVV